jgi:hypothetical protein
MARLPRYSPLGVSIASVPGLPTVDYTAAASAEARGYESLSRALDKVSQFAFEKMAKQAELEGAKFRFDNPITSEQVRAALAEGRDIDEIVGDPGTIFGAASRATAVTQLKTELEGRMQTYLAGVSARVNAGEEFDIVSTKEQINAMIEGGAEVLGSVDPKKAYAFSASATTMAAPLYRTMLEKKIKLDRVAKHVNYDNVKANTLAALTSIFESDAGDTVTIEGKQIPEYVVRIENLRRVTQDAAIATNDPALVRQSAADFNKTVDSARIEVLRKFARENPDAVNVDRGDFGRYTKLYYALDEDQKKKVRSEVRTEEAELYKAKRDEDQKVKDSRKNAVNALLVKAIQLPAGSPEHSSVMEKLNGFAAIGDVSQDQYKTAAGGFKAKELKDDPFVVGELERLIDFGRIPSLDSLQKRMVELRLTPATQNKLRDDLSKSLDKDYAEAKRIISESAGVFPNVQYANSDKSLKASRIFARMESEFEAKKQDLAKEGAPLITMTEFAKKFVEKGVEDRKSDLVSTARERLSEELKAQGINGINVDAITLSNIDEYIEGLGKKEYRNNNYKRQVIDQIQQLKTFLLNAETSR